MLLLPAWLTPNMLSCFRGALALPVAILFRYGADDWAIALWALAMTLDFFDGALAEARNLKTELGAFLDPLADKLLNCGVLIGLYGRLALPFNLAVWLIVGFALALTGVRVAKWLKNLPMAATPDGKLKLLVETGTLAAVALGVALPQPDLALLGGCMLFILPVLAAKSLVSQLEPFWE